MGKYFGTDGVRGVAGSSLDITLASNLGRYVTYLMSERLGQKIRIVIGKDTRISGDMLESAFIGGALSEGAEVIPLGIIPTPAVAFHTRKHNAHLGVVISASHNPMEYNGIKFFNSKGEKLSDELEAETEEYLLGNKTIEHKLTGADIGKITYTENAGLDYLEFALSEIDASFDGMKIAVDCSNGANYKIAPEAFRRLGAEVFVKSAQPDGTNINKDCGSVNIKSLSDFTVSCGADIGIAFDGDADRVLAVDEKGNIIDGDVIIGILAIDLKKKGLLKNNIVVGTVMSNIGLEISLKKHGIDFIAANVGDRFVYEKMMQLGGCIGGEQSGHIILTSRNSTGDGLVCALEFLSLFKRSGVAASELTKEIKIFPQVLVNARIENEFKASVLSSPAVLELISATEQKYASCGRILVRPSGTEPLVRIMIEGENLDEMEKDAIAIKNLMLSVVTEKG